MVIFRHGVLGGQIKNYKQPKKSIKLPKREELIAPVELNSPEVIVVEEEPEVIPV